MSADHRRGIFAASHLIYPSVRVEIREPRCHREQEIGKFWSLLCIGVVWSPSSATPNRKQSCSSILANRHYFVCCRRICFVADRQTFSLWENLNFFFDELVAVQDLQRMTEGTLAGIWVLTRQRQNRYRCALQFASLLFFLCSHFCLWRRVCFILELGAAGSDRDARMSWRNEVGGVKFVAVLMEIRRFL